MTDKNLTNKPARSIRGFREPQPVPSLLQGKSITVKAEFRPGGSRTARTTEVVSYDPDAIIEVEFVDGHRLWMHVDEYREHFSNAVSRDAIGQEYLTVPAELDLLPGGLQSRGPVKWAVAALRVLGVDLAEKTAQTIFGEFDKSHAKGLLQCTMRTGSFGLLPLSRIDAGKLSTDDPCLLFIHGTFSSTRGSFGELWSEARSAELAALGKFYGDRVLAFEHGTTVTSPVENTLELVKSLPDGITLHVLSHSRGGLVGELLCRGNRVAFIAAKRTAQRDGGAGNEREPFTPDELRLFDNEEWRGELPALRELCDVLIQKRITVERFVRVACPARGTTFASGRLDRWLSVMGSIAGFFGSNSPLYELFSDIGDFAAAVIKERTDPKTMPGIAAMMPDSPLIRLVNWPETAIPGDLTVIAGDIEPDAWWAKLLVFVTDRFYDGDHDLVVNTPSMFGGTKRTGRALAGMHKGPGVNHFSYFHNTDSARQVVQALTSNSREGFGTLEEPVSVIARGTVPRTAVPQPVVFVLPGIMGSELAVGKDRVWVDIPDLVFGGLEKLQIDAADIVPTQPIDSSYGKLIGYLSNKNRVIPFPYDWRLPIEQEADRLAKRLQQELEDARRSGQPVRLLAHSMGGLVARAMIARHDALWRDICAERGGRMIMLGTPNGGSYTITELLVGQNETIRQLGLIDIKHSLKELLGIVARFPGMLAMLPVDRNEDYFSEQVWQDYHGKKVSAGNGSWIVPDKSDLDRARDFRKLLDSSPLDPEHMVYVAGSADITTAGMRYNDKKERIEFLGTSRGDGRVTWESGIPSGIPTYYMDAKHGDMPADEEYFDAIAELLEKGTTMHLPQTAPVSRSADELFALPQGSEALYPDEPSLVNAALGSGARNHRSRKQHAAPVKVSIVHGNLTFATYPVAVGHYLGDTIVSAEQYLDKKLDGALTLRSQLGLYPGAIETNAFIINTRLRNEAAAKPSGALIIGLGSPINLTASLLTRSFEKAVLEYVSAWTQNSHLLQNTTDTIGLTTLLVGTGAGGVSLPDALYAILNGVIAANRKLDVAKRSERICHVEIIEVWEDVAIQAAKTLLRMQQSPEMNRMFIFDGKLLISKDGRQRVCYEEAPDWWQRLQVLAGDEGGVDHGMLRFTASTQRARSEVRLLPTQRLLVDRFIEEAIGTASNDQSISHTLFELLLPNELKNQAPDQDDLVYLLDEASARYPWELLEDPAGKDGPFVVRHGLIRQLAAPQFREGVKNTLSATAFVVGDPVTEFIELPGAQGEARSVAQRLGADGRFTVTALIRPPDSSTVIKALFEKSYRVIHLAGHGVYEYVSDDENTCRICGQPLRDFLCPEHGDKRIRHTGMVLGNGVYLTPMEIRQMREVPDLVFINCCHCGRIEPGTERDLNIRQDYNVLAANLSTEFIRMGVRAVVAAGWAVDDAAATTFAGTFYSQILSGQRFGDAVRIARWETHNRHPRVNTWGAYQCYGDPDFHLVRSNSLSSAGKPKLYVSSGEVVQDILNVKAWLSTRAEGDVEKGLTQLTELTNALKKNGWYGDADATIALANAYGEAYRFGEAIGYYRRARELDDSLLTLKDIEQFANFLGRHAVVMWKERSANLDKRDDPKKKSVKSIAITPEENIAEAFMLLEWLETLENAGTTGKTGKGLRRTTEGLSLRASTLKLRAWISSDPVGDLDAMAVMYKKAYDLSCEKGTADPYPLINELFTGLVRAWFGKTTRLKASRIKEADELVRMKQSSTSFWDIVMPVDLALYRMLNDTPLDDGKTKELADHYLQIRTFGSPREFASTIEKIEFLETMANRANKSAVAKQLGELRRLMSVKKPAG